MIVMIQIYFKKYQIITAVTKQQLESGALTSVDDLPAYGQHNLTVTGSVGHQIQHLLVRTTFHHHAIDANQLVSRSQTTVLLCSSVGHNGPDVHLGKHVLIEQNVERGHDVILEFQHLLNP